MILFIGFGSYLRASMGKQQPEKLRYLRLRELVKNCLNDGGTSLPFFEANRFLETFKCVRWVVQPRKRAPKSC
jgi:hypothetical protein